MAWFAGKSGGAQSLVRASGCFAESHAAARPERAVTRNRSPGCLEQDRRRIYRRPFRAGRVARRRALCARPSAGVALRARTDLEDRNPAKTETALWREDHP